MRLLDLFCGSGGAALGYHRVGFEVVGVDNNPKPLLHYPFDSVCDDALEYVAAHGHEFDAIHASPPCQGYSIMQNLPWLRHMTYPLLILPTLELLEDIGKPYVIENVMGARHGAKGLAKRGLEAHGLKAGWLCGSMFGLPLYRHRLFATNWLWLAPEHPKHRKNCAPLRDKKGTTEPGYGLTQWQNGAQTGGVGIGHAKGWSLAAQMMGIDWMRRAELTQAIPPVYTEFIGKQLMAYLENLG